MEIFKYANLFCFILLVFIIFYYRIEHTKTIFGITESYFTQIPLAV